MHRSIRRLIFAVFVIIFLVSAPLVVLYTAGYRLNVSNQRWQQTGVLAVATYPRSASVILGGQEFAQKSPAVFQRLMPNTHEIILRKRGYHDWSQRIKIEGGKSTYVTARLFADTSPQVLNETQALEALRARPLPASINPTELEVVFLDNGANVEVRLGSENGQLVGLLPRGEYELLVEDAEYLLLSNERQVAFMIARQGGEVVELPVGLRSFDWLETENLLLWSDGTEVNVYEAENNTRTFITREGQSVLDVAWHPSADSFFVANAEVVSAYDALIYETREITPLIAGETVVDIWLDGAGKNLYFSQQELVIESEAEIEAALTPATVIQALPLVL